MGHGNAKKPVETYRVAADTANTAAAAISPQEAEVNAYTSKLWNIYTGKEKFDLKSLPNANVLMPLYDQAKAHSDVGRIGKGLAYGGNAGSEAYNPNLVASIDAQNQEERERDAAGQLESRVVDTFAGLPNQMLGLGQMDQSRRDNSANRAMGMYSTEAQIQEQKDAKPKWWEKLLSGSVSAGTGLLTSGLSSIGGGAGKAAGRQG